MKNGIKITVTSIIEWINNNPESFSRLKRIGILLWNLLYAVFNGIIGLKYKSYWFLWMAAWYMIIHLLRLLVISDSKIISNRRKAAGSGICQLAVVLAGIICIGIIERRNPIRSEIIMIVLALYTFVTLAFAIINVIKARKKEDDLLEIEKDVSLVSAIGSMLSLERGMLGTFGDASDKLTLILEASTGAVAVILILLIGISLIRNKTGNKGLS
jgi:hypothetical protein